MIIKLTGHYTQTPELVTPEIAIDVLRDCEIEHRLSEKEIRARWERGESVDNDTFTAEPVEFPK